MNAMQIETPPTEKRYEKPEGERRGLVIVNTGDGKGKSTAAFGTALRGWAQGWSIGVFQFVKSSSWHTGERVAFEALDALHRETGQGGPVGWIADGLGFTWTRRGGDLDAQAEIARATWGHVRELMAAQAHRLYVLDEFTYPLLRGWVDLDEVLQVLAERPGVARLRAADALPGVPDCAVGDDVQLWPQRHGTDAMYLALLRVPHAG